MFHCYYSICIIGLQFSCLLYTHLGYNSIGSYIGTVSGITQSVLKNPSRITLFAGIHLRLPEFCVLRTSTVIYVR